MCLAAASLVLQPRQAQLHRRVEAGHVADFGGVDLRHHLVVLAGGRQLEDPLFALLVV